MNQKVELSSQHIDLMSKTLSRPADIFHISQMNHVPENKHQDARFLSACLRLARKHQGMTGTNPSVACIIVKDFGHGPVIVGSGVTAIGGRPHAEPPAIMEAGEAAKGATAYVTLEPCAHHGKTPPCAQTLIDAGISRIVTAITDPDERVNGKGHQMMAEAGIAITQLDGGERARRVMAGYLSARSEKRPFVMLKLAMTNDGLIGSKNRGNFRVSGAGANRQTHLCRARYDAILVGAGTAIADDPQLTCRLPGLEARSPLRVILDASSRLCANGNLINPNPEIQTIVAGRADASQEWLDMLRSNGVQHLACEVSEGKIALPELLDDLLARGIQSIMVEGGARLSKSFLDEGLVDEIIVHVGGKPDTLKPDETPVYAPFTPKSLPNGFRICQEMVFGDDVSLRLVRE